ncbi:hypothetical protein R3P38DRAFT_2794589 [Favolaschia claudopus]|uniref:Transposase n=1 Tax=Favolaschia claudopus TaxID=2862362 RepID=A0AAW0A8I0_9AGAR
MDPTTTPLSNAYSFPLAPLQHKICSLHLLAEFGERLSKIPRPIRTPKARQDGSELSAVGRSARGQGRGQLPSRATPRSPTPYIRFFEDLSFKNADAWIREWVVAAWSPNVSQWVAMGRIKWLNYLVTW